MLRRAARRRDVVQPTRQSMDLRKRHHSETGSAIAKRFVKRMTKRMAKRMYSRMTNARRSRNQQPARTEIAPALLTASE